MKRPIRYTASRREVKSTRYLRSGTSNRFCTTCIAIFRRGHLPPARLAHSRRPRAPLRSLASSQHLGRPAGRRDLLLCRATELVGADRELLADVAAAEHLDLAARAADQPALGEQLRRHFRPRVEHLGNRVEIDDRELLAERVVETALRHAPMQRHLPALEAALHAPARARLRTLVAAAGRLAVPGALAAPHALLRVLRALRRFETRQRHIPTQPSRDDAPCGSCRASRPCPAASPSAGCGAAPYPGRPSPGPC